MLNISLTHLYFHSFILHSYHVIKVFQSGFKTSHSTESALLKVVNDVFLTQTLCAVVLLDLTAAFNTVDYQIPLLRLQTWVGVQGGAWYFCNVLYVGLSCWFKSCCLVFAVTSFPSGSLLDSF